MRFFSLLTTRKNTESKIFVEFFIRMCGDVLLDVLHWGDRYQLAELEKNGRRFFWFIDRYFKEAPFLRLNLELIPLYFFSYFFNIINLMVFTDFL